MKENFKCLEDDDVFTSTYKALELLVNVSYSCQLNQKLDYLSPMSKDKEYCTIKMFTTRQTGHSTAICKLVFKYFKNAIFISPNINMSINLRKCFYNIVNNNILGYKSIKTIDSFYNFISKNCIVPGATGRCFEAVIVDGYFDINKREESLIYKTFMTHMIRTKPYFFIFIQ
jgi:hypothetical protein